MIMSDVKSDGGGKNWGGPVKGVEEKMTRVSFPMQFLKTTKTKMLSYLVQYFLLLKKKKKATGEKRAVGISSKLIKGI